MMLISTLLLLCNPLMAQAAETSSQTIATSSGIGLGTAIAVVASWSRNKSILWAIIHGVFGWLYVIYFALTR
ncbi:MAG: hypothetical protein ACR2IL_02535 [Chitinophagaceae bacterium]